MNGGCLVPANAKKSMKILGFLRPMPDLVILITGILATVIIMLMIDTNNIIITICACLPAFIGVGLVLPIPNYHNVMVAIGSVIKYYNNRRCYVWKGWCCKDEFK